MERSRFGWHHLGSHSCLKSLYVLLALMVVISLLAACGGSTQIFQTVKIQAYRLETELPQGLPQQVPCYQVQKPKGSEFEWAQRVASALGFTGDPNESRAAALPEWSWVGPERDMALSVNGNIAYGCSSPPAGAESSGAPENAEQAIAVVHQWLTARDLLPADCADDVLAWPGANGLGWEVRFRRLDGRPVGSYWGWTGGLQVRLNSLGEVDSVGYLRHDVAKGTLVPLRPVQQAWQELQERGPAFFDCEGPSGPTWDCFTVTQVEIGYRECCYAGTEVQEQLRPYYVFSGEAEIANWGRKSRASAYVPAWK